MQRVLKCIHCGELRGPRRCKPCTVKRGKAWREARDADPARVRTRDQQNRANWLKNKYGLTPEQYDAMLQAQAGGCKICGLPAEKNVQRRPGSASPPCLDVDHDHVTGRVRGLLCFNCNTGLARFLEQPRFLAAAIEYLKEPHGDS